MYGCSRINVPASEYWEIELNRKVMAGSPKTEFVLRTCTVSGIKFIGDMSFFIVPEATVSDESARDAEAGKNIVEFCRNNPVVRAILTREFSRQAVLC